MGASVQSVLGRERTQRLMRNLSDLDHVTRSSTQRSDTRLPTERRSGKVLRTDDVTGASLSAAGRGHSDVTRLRHSDDDVTEPTSLKKHCSDQLSKDHDDDDDDLVYEDDDPVLHDDLHIDDDDLFLDDVDLLLGEDLVYLDDDLVRSSSSVQQHIDAIKGVLRHR